MSHVAQEILEIHEGMPNTLPFGPLRDAEDVVLTLADAPTVTIYHRSGGYLDEEVDAEVGGETWPLETVENITDETWDVELGVLEVRDGERLWIKLEFMDPADNDITIIYRALVVPAVGP